MNYKNIVSSKYLEDNSDKTSLVKDRIIPNIKAKGYGLAGAMTGATLGAGAALIGRKATRTGIKKAFSPKTTDFIKKNISANLSEKHRNYAKSRKIRRMAGDPVKLLLSDEMAKARNIAVAGAGAAAGAKVGSRTGEVLGNTSRVKELYRGQFGVDPSENEIFESAKLNPRSMVDRGLYKYFYTPESMTKSNFRNIRQMNNSQHALDPRESMNGDMSMNNNRFSFQGNRFKNASQETELMEKTAIKINPSNVGKKYGTVVGKASKYSPAVGAGLLGTGMVAPAVVTSKMLVDDDSKNRKTKRRGLEAGLIGAGAGVGAAIGKSTGALSKSLFEKATNPNKATANAVKDYINLFKKANMESKAMEKIAKKESFEGAVNRRLSTNPMSDSEFKTFADRMNQRYGANSIYNKDMNPSKSYAVLGDNLRKMNPQTLKALGIPNTEGKNFVRSLPLEEVLVHETGHLLDKNLPKTSKKIMKYKALGNASSVAGGVGATLAGNKYVSAASGVGGVGLGTYLTDRAGKATEKREDDANKFVKKYYRDKFKDKQKADDFINNESVIPAARKTYRTGRILGTAGHAVSYGVPTAFAVSRKFM